MELSLFQVDAFASEVFRGNPAAVMPLTSWLDDALLQALALENNVSETAFIVPDEGQADFHLRWFTPCAEVDLCGHATLATGHVLFEHLGMPGDRIDFRTRSGLVGVMRDGALLTLDFPARPPQRIASPPSLQAALGYEPLEVHEGEYTLAVVEDEATVTSTQPDFDRIAELDGHALMITARGDEVDFVSRFFAPSLGVNEDPVTGSAHTTLAPYWAERLGKQELVARQLSARGGELRVRLAPPGRVLISGHAVTYLEGVARPGATATLDSPPLS